MCRRSSCLVLLGALVFALAGVTAAPRAEAAAVTWTDGYSVNWADAPNWSGGLVPATGSSLVFGASGSSGTNLTDNLLTLSGSTLSAITFNAGASAFTFNPGGSTNGFALIGPIANKGTNLETINDPITMAATQTFTTTAGGGNLTLGGSLSGAGGLIVNGGGVVTLSGSMGVAYTGNTTVNGGTLTSV